MSDSELEEDLQQIAGAAFGKGASAEEVVDALESVQERFKRLREVES